MTEKRRGKGDPIDEFVSRETPISGEYSADVIRLGDRRAKKKARQGEPRPPEPAETPEDRPSGDWWFDRDVF